MPCSTAGLGNVTTPGGLLQHRTITRRSAYWYLTSSARAWMLPCPRLSAQRLQPFGHSPTTRPALPLLQWQVHSVSTNPVRGGESSWPLHGVTSGIWNTVGDDRGAL